VACEAVCCSLSCRLCVAAVVFSVLDLYYAALYRGVDEVTAVVAVL
jgi:hypothetical protein